ncbi:MAG: glutaminase A [Rubrobacter sp.]|nr:glutaminase A [Rubrobacter sp.]
MPTPEMERRVNRRLDELYERHVDEHENEVVEYYDPEAPEEEKESFGVSLVSAADGMTFETGEHDVPFPLQSISKAFVYGMALEDCGRESVLKKVGVEPSGEAFNSIEFDERANRPHNPMVNAGALATTSLVLEGDEPEKCMERILTALRKYSGNDALDVNEELLAAQFEDTDRNRAIAYLMRSHGMIEGDVEAILELYLRQCSVFVTTHDLGMMASTLANGGVNPETGERALEGRYVRDLLSVLYTCGMYDAAGQWAYEVGIPAKSGVSGGIMAIVPGKLGIAVYSPGLDEYGNSVRGIKVCEEISERLGLHVFANEAEDILLGTAKERR